MGGVTEVVVRSEQDAHPEKPEGYVVFHNSNYGSASFDVFVRSDRLESWKRMEDRLYPIDCTVVDDFKKRHPDYAYIGSEDLEHGSRAMDIILELLFPLYLAGFEFIDYELWGGKDG